MPKSAANELVEFLDDRAGEYLRGAVHYSESDYEVLYLRDDVNERYTDETLAELFEYYREQNRAREREKPFDLGNDHCTVDFYDEAILFHFTQGDDVGTVITLDPGAGRDVNQFIVECLEQLHRNSPQRIDAAPDWIDG
ncbi:DUF7522 family protein [Halorientalis halophila]|uniref:DUF7522 family protein n=1 Tax=Halorientalis halophila TaxID=3108499 RepID=UPI00300B9E48